MHALKKKEEKKKGLCFRTQRYFQRKEIQKDSIREDPFKPRNQQSHSTPTTTPMMPQAKARGLFFHTV